MASFQQNKKNKLWSVRFRILQNGVVIQKRLSGFKTKKEANEEHIKFLASYVPSSFKISEKSDFVFSNILKNYFIIDARSTKPSTHKDKKSIFNLYILPYFQNKLINNLDKKQFNEWQTTLWSYKKYDKLSKQEKYLSHTYLSKIKKVFNHFLNWVEEVYSIPNQLRMVRTPKNTEAKKEMLIWELNEFNLFIENVDDVLWRTFFMFQFYNGSRLGETLALSEGDYTGSSIVINKSLTKKTLNGEKYQITATKNYKNRENPLLDVLNKQLQDYLRWKKDNNLSAKFLFGGTTPLSPTTIRRSFDYYLSITNSKLDNKLIRIRIHDLRHSFVSLLANKGISTKIIADLVGDTEETVIKTYKHLYKNDKKEAISRINLAI